MDRSTKPYLLLHYLLLVALILLAIDVVEGSGIDLPFWAGLLIAIGIGITYPRFLEALGIAPERWER
ncbi:MAG: hypothetical protein ACQETB_12680 [Halobacteriota archaeon]